MLNLTPDLLVPDADCEYEGRFCRMIKNDALQAHLQAHYGRPGLCLKVNKQSDDEAWEWSNPYELAMLQNIGAIHGVAPRVYDVFELRKGQQAMVMDWARDQVYPSFEGVLRLLKLIDRYYIGTHKVAHTHNRKPKWDIVPSVNWAGDWFLDWGGFYLIDPEDYRNEIVASLKVHIATQLKGQPAETTYQSLPELGIHGDRDTAHRLDVMGWDNLEWQGKDVLDIGCNLGAFTIEAAKRGARRAVGADLPFIAEPMRHAANWLHRWNVDFVNARLPKRNSALATRANLSGFDVVLALSICQHVGGYAPWIAGLVKPGGLLILETHGDESPAEYEADLRRDFERVDLVGYTTDVKRRGVFICEKGAA